MPGKQSLFSNCPATVYDNFQQYLKFYLNFVTLSQSSFMLCSLFPIVYLVSILSDYISRPQNTEYLILMPKRSHTLLLNVRRSNLEIFVGERDESYAISITLIFNLLPWNRTRCETRDLIDRFMRIFITSNDCPFGCPIICRDIYSQCSCVHWYLQQCLIQSSSLDNQDAILVKNC